MKSIHLIICLLMIHFVSFAADTKIKANLHTELAIFRFENCTSDWKKLNKSINKDESLIEFILAEQSPYNFSELITIQYIDSSAPKRELKSVEQLLNTILKTTSAAYIDQEYKWSIIEKNPDNYIYEWDVREQNRKRPREHEICRLFLTDKGNVLRVAYTRKNGQISPADKEKWTDLLRNHVFIVTAEDLTGKELSINSN